jgi:hypothetical protein
MAGCEADELDLGRVGLYMYQQITKRYVLLRCDYPASGFYLTDQIQAYPKQVFGFAFKMLVQHRDEGGSLGRVIDSGCPTKGKLLTQ